MGFIYFGFEVALFHFFVDGFVFLGFKSAFLKALVEQEAVLDFGLGEGDLFVALFGHVAGLV